MINSGVGARSRQERTSVIARLGMAITVQYMEHMTSQYVHLILEDQSTFTVEIILCFKLVA